MTEAEIAIPPATSLVMSEIAAERAAQEAKWGEQNHPDGTGLYTIQRIEAAQFRDLCQQHAALGTLTWQHILDEEIHEAAAESDPERIRAELVQVAAVAVAWIEAIDRRIAALPNDDCRGVDQCDAGTHCAHVPGGEQCCHCGHTLTTLVEIEASR